MKGKYKRTLDKREISTKYLTAKRVLESTMTDIEHDIALLIKKNGYPIIIGYNSIYGLTDNGRPGYWDEDSQKFFPIYDREESYEFGWADFEECCNIFDVIKTTLENKKDIVAD